MTIPSTTPNEGPDARPGTPARRALRLAALAVLVLVPFALRLWPIEHGLPRNYIPDTHVVNGALGMAKDRDPVPPVGRYSTYPNLLPYTLLPIYAAQYALGRVRGDWAGTGEFRNRVLEHPEVAHLPARLLVALLGALTPWVIWRTARAAGLREGAWAAAWLAATGLLHVHFSVQERPWAPLVFFMALAAWPCARYARTGSGRDLALAGFAAGLAFATHQAGLLALAIPGLGWLLGPVGWRRDELGRRLLQGVGCVALFALVALTLGHPYLIRYGLGREGMAAEQQMGDQGINIGGQGFIFDLRWASVERLGAAIVGYDPVIVLLGLVGLWGSLALRGTRAVTLFTLLWAALFFTNHNDHVRYLLPVTVLLALPAGLAVEMLASRRWTWILLGPLLLLPLVQSARLDWLLRRLDTRAIAEVHLRGLPEGARIAIDRYGPLLDPDRASLERLASWRPLGARESHRLLLLQALDEAGVDPEGRLPGGRGRDVVRLEDLFRFDERAGVYRVAAARRDLGRDAAEVLRALGVTHLVLVDRRPGDGIPPLLLHRPSAAPAAGGDPPGAPLVLTGPPRLRVDPSREGIAREALLPTEMDFPLIGLWEVVRPGPLIEVREL